MMNPPPTAAAAIFFFFLFFKKNVHTDRVRVGQKKGRKKDAFFFRGERGSVDAYDSFF